MHDVFQRAADLAGEYRQTSGVTRSAIEATVNKVAAQGGMTGLLNWELVAMACYHQAVAEPQTLRLVNVGPDDDDGNEMSVVELHREGKPALDLLGVIYNPALGTVQVGTWDGEPGGGEWRELAALLLPEGE